MAMSPTENLPRAELAPVWREVNTIRTVMKRRFCRLTYVRRVDTTVMHSSLQGGPRAASRGEAGLLTLS